ncbi:Transmembrane osmosensor [Paramarasmius palmivorus]|uniref:Transmembrane osmosensor n=1 Tax=Paramarasmius palmivorus TaxID=297713 RepID=A0AAW0DT11_9AGAR
MLKTFSIVISIAANAAWVAAIVSQGLARARLGRESVGVLWFAVILQLLVNYLASFCLFRVLKDRTYRHHITTYAAICTIFGVIAVDANIFSEIPIQRAIGAFWLILVVVDLVWIAYFALDTRSRAWKIINGYEERLTSSSESARSDYRVAPNRSEDEEANKLAMVQEPPAHAVQVPSPANGASAPSTTTTGSVPRMGLGRRAAREEGTHSETGWKTISDGGESNATGLSSEPSYSRRARVLYDYEGTSDDPNSGQLSFKKGDILSVSGAGMNYKWWPTQLPDGRTGLAPSNFLQLMSEPQPL